VGPVKKKFIDYPRAGRRGVLRWFPSWRLILAFFVLGAASVITVIGVAYARTAVPGVAQITEAQASIVYYDDGKTEIGRFQVQNRVILEHDQIPDQLREAVIAAEDRSFKTNQGISPTGIARAAVNNLRGRPLQGGSTLTQQYVKNVLLDTQERSYQRKVKEFFIAVKVARDTDKDKILDAYMNTIYLGRNAYGVEAAAQTYFHKPAAKLSVSQAAYMAGIINGPELYDPDDGKAAKAASMIRWNYALDSMVTTGALSQADRDKQKFPKVFKRQTQNNQSGQRGYLMQMVRSELKGPRIGYSDAVIDTQGLRITTTFNKPMMDAAVQAVQDGLPDDAPKTVQVGLATVDPATGAVKALYGGKDFLKHPFNNATQAGPQAGSTFKPFALVTGLEKGIGLKTRFNGNSGQEFEGYPRPVSNFDPQPWGNVDLVTATANSINTVYMALNLEVKAENTKATAIKAGIPDDKDGLSAEPSNVLGPDSVHPIDMASAYGIFADRGIKAERYVVQKITRPDGSDDAHEAKTKRVFRQDVMDDTVYAMQQVVEQGSGGAAKALGRPVAGKTGTSSNNMSAWFVGYTPQLSTAVAFYRDADKGTGIQSLGSWGGRNQITGGSFPAEIWTAYMKAALDGTKVEEFPEPAWIGGERRIESTRTGAPSTATSTPTPSVTPSATQTQTPSPTTSRTPEPTLTTQPSAPPTTTAESTEEPTPTPTEEEPAPTTSDGDGEDPGPGESPSPSP
jgi:membrane peptidoglycan carboxypeptidase